jgi:hypothetical protein
LATSRSTFLSFLLTFNLFLLSFAFSTTQPYFNTCGGIHPNPGPNLVNNPASQQSTSQQPSNRPSPNCAIFLHWNCNGIKNSITELKDFIRSYQLKIVSLQETKLCPSVKDPSFPDYAILCSDRPVGGGGGLAFLIHHLLQYTLLDTSSVLPGDTATELLAISTTINRSEFYVFNVYVPPSSSCPPRFKPDFEKDSLISLTVIQSS